MFQFIKGCLSHIGGARTPKKRCDATVEQSNSFLDWLRDAARRELQRQRDHPVSEEAKQETIKNELNRVRQVYPNLDEAVVHAIAEDEAAVYQLIDEICRRRLQAESPNSDAVEIQMSMMLIAGVPIRLVEGELLQRMHLPREERVEQVAVIMVGKVLAP